MFTPAGLIFTSMFIQYKNLSPGALTQKTRQTACLCVQHENHQHIYIHIYLLYYSNIYD